MKNNKSKQIYITSFTYPLDSVKTIFFNYKTCDLIFKGSDYNIKKFIGSDWSIIGSGFIFTGPKDLNIAFTVSKIEKNEFNIINKFSITYLNEKQNNNKIDVILSLISNTIDYSTIVEFRLEFEKDSDLQYINDFVKLSLIKKILSQICFNINNLIKLNDKNEKNNNDLLIINHSFIIKNNYMKSFNYFYNFNNLAKSLKVDKIWKIIYENEEGDNNNYKNITMYINNNRKIHYKVVSIIEEKDKKIEIIYNKTSNSFPALNNYIKFYFFNVAQEMCFFLYETHLPICVPSSIFKKISDYLYYINIRSKNNLESDLLNNN